ncbi:MAG: ABC transporter permease [Gemmatimonadetes bacterium]|nr:ABC transporter permease [Gemmatimonadota bacterium]
MLKNYIKIAFKVFWRHKFFTAVNLFGICFTLVVLMLATGFIDQQVGPIPPEVHANRTLHLNWLFVKYASRESDVGIFKPSYAFLDRYVSSLETAENVTVFSDVDYQGMHGGAEEGSVKVKMTDGAYWEVFRFNFRQGRPYNVSEVESGDFVAVVSADFSKRFFGSEVVVGKSVLIEGQNYRIVGVVGDAAGIRERTDANVWVPLSTNPSQEWRTYKLQGRFNAAVLARRPADMERIRTEFATVLEQVEDPPDERFPISAVSAPLLTTLEAWARNNKPDWTEDYRKGGDPLQAAAARLRLWLLTVGGYMLLFMLLPVLHLVNLNIGRIEERTSEIGVRKSFGASTRTLVGQFVAENVLLTLVGGALSLPLSWGILALMSGVTFMDVGVLIRTFAYGVLIAVFFGVVSGAYPAWKMARLHPVRALTGREK